MFGCAVCCAVRERCFQLCTRSVNCAGSVCGRSWRLAWTIWMALLLSLVVVVLHEPRSRHSQPRHHTQNLQLNHQKLGTRTRSSTWTIVIAPFQSQLHSQMQEIIRNAHRKRTHKNPQSENRGVRNLALRRDYVLIILSFLLCFKTVINSFVSQL